MNNIQFYIRGSIRKLLFKRGSNILFIFTLLKCL